MHVLWRAPPRGPRIYRMKTYTQVYTRDHKGLGRSIWKALCECKHVRLFSTPVQATRGADLPTFWYTKRRAMTAREHPWQNVPDEFSWRGGIYVYVYIYPLDPCSLIEKQFHLQTNAYTRDDWTSWERNRSNPNWIISFYIFLIWLNLS